MELSQYNPDQLKAVKTVEGPLMILAGAGSGKTRTLIGRIQYLFEERRVSPFQVLAVTFSNKAAKEMRERLSQVSDYDIGSFQVTTFHAFCAKVLRYEASYIGLSRNFTIYDASESHSVAKAVLGMQGISTKDISPYTLNYYIDSLKNMGHTAEDEVTPEVESQSDDSRMYNLFLSYEAELNRNNAVDFGSLITGVLKLFKSYPEVLKKYQTKFKYILVDEYQDTNRAQFHLIKLLSEGHQNICVVGDEDQSIYSWRGADIRNILDFEEYFQGAQFIKLEQNYRSSKKIIEAAGHVISQNQSRKGKNMWTDNPDGEVIQVQECRDEKSEAEYIAGEVRDLIEKGCPASQIAIVYRSNSQSRGLEDAFRKLKINYKVVAGIKFYDRKEIKDLIAYMRVVVNSKDSLSLSRVINVPARGIGATSLRKLEDEAVKLNISLLELIEQISDKKMDFNHLRLSSKVVSGLRMLSHLFEEARLMDGKGELPSATFSKLLNESGYLEFLKADKSYEGQARIENLDELSNAISQFESSEESPTLTSFLESITLDQSLEEEDSTELVSLMTAHGSKGLEYFYVFLAGAEENIFPSYKSLESGPLGLEEERRLFYVAMTRAMKKLYITFAQGRMLWGSLKFNGPSQFIQEIPSDYYSWDFYQTDKKNARGEGGHYDEFSQENSFEEKVYYQPRLPSKYQSGMKVSHALYGSGVVVKSEGSGSEEKVLIKFQDGGQKKFMVKFAPLERV